MYILNVIDSHKIIHNYLLFNILIIVNCLEKSDFNIKYCSTKNELRDFYPQTPQYIPIALILSINDNLNEFYVPKCYIKWNLIHTTMYFKKQYIMQISEPQWYLNQTHWYPNEPQMILYKPGMGPQWCIPKGILLKVPPKIERSRNKPH